MKAGFTEFSLDDAPAFKRELLSAIERGDREIDLSGVVTADSALLSVLLAGRRRAPDLKITALPAALLELAELYGVTELLGAGKPAAGAAIRS